MNKELTEALAMWDDLMPLGTDTSYMAAIVAAAREHLDCGTVTDQMVERAAAHILAQVNGDDPGTERWDKLDQTYGELAEEIREQYRGMAQAALEADQ